MKKFTIGFLVLAMVALGTIFAFVQKTDKEHGRHHFGGGGRGGFGHFAEKLNLTDAQKAQFKQIRETSKTKIQPLMENMKSIRQQLQAATTDGKFDEAQVQNLATQQANVMAQLTVEKERVKSQMFAILTADQQAQLKTLKDQMKEKLNERFQNRANKSDENNNS